MPDPQPQPQPQQQPSPAAPAPGQQPATQQTPAAPGPEAAVIAGAEHPDAVRNLIDRERDARRQAEARAEEAERVRQEIEDQSKTAEQRAQEAQQAKADVAKLTAESLRLRVALKKGLTGDRAELADRLQGTTEAELEADADKLLALVGGGSGQQPAPPSGGVRTPTDASLSMDDRIRAATGRGRR